ncbi:hypothetical protein EDD22DRAFT_847615 [Suillus occidentalis]|nr:hypothetical protein EDD22DRAFT_847615 [Suillus occidentalis]
MHKACARAYLHFHIVQQDDTDIKIPKLHAGLAYFIPNEEYKSHILKHVIYKKVIVFIFGIPKFHCPTHNIKCTTPYSLNLMPGVGHTDGEGIEHNWLEMNYVANSMKEMGLDSQHDTLDDYFSHHNWCKYIALAEDWEYDKSLLNPYINFKYALTEAQFHAQLVDDEKSAAASGNAHPQETTLIRFIILALMLEESQHTLCHLLLMVNKFFREGQ